MAFDPRPTRDEFDEFGDLALDDAPIRRSRAIRWTAILVVASFALAALSSLFHLL